MPSACRLTHLDPAPLARARLKIAWEVLAQAAEHVALLPLTARAHGAEALSKLALAKALVAEWQPVAAKDTDEEGLWPLST
jgi:hypothetical protein